MNKSWNKINLIIKVYQRYLKITVLCSGDKIKAGVKRGKTQWNITRQLNCKAFHYTFHT